MVEVDLSIKVAGLTFKNPIVPGPSEICDNPKTIKKCIQYGFGGILTKSYTHLKPMQVVSHPTFAFADPLGEEYRMLLAHGAGMPITPERALKKDMPEISKMCKEAELPLLVSIAPNPEIEVVTKLCNDFVDAGADGIILNTGCGMGDWWIYKERCKELGIDYDKIGKFGSAVARDIPLITQLIKQIKKESGVPIFLKVNPLLEPLEDYVDAWMKAGAEGIEAHDGFGVPALIDVENECQYFTCWPTGGSVGNTILRLVSVGRIVRVLRIFSRLEVIGSGGVFKAPHALQYLLAGAKLAEVCTAVYYYGYSVIPEILEGIKSWMDRKGYDSVNQFLGKALKSYGKPVRPAGPALPDETRIPCLPKINYNLCLNPRHCTRCVDVCMYDALEIDREKNIIKVKENECYGCGLCVSVCPVAGCMSMITRDTGEIEWNLIGQAKYLKPVTT